MAELSKPRIIAILAADLNGCIGRNNTIPWRLKTDMRLFRETTSGSPVIMGRKTAESLGNKPLPNRENWVLSRDAFQLQHFEHLGFRPAPALHVALTAIQAAGHAKAFIIGGAAIYKLAMDLDLVDEVRLTLVHAQITDGDVFFDVRQYLADWQRSLELVVAANPPTETYAFDVLKFVKNK